MYQVQDQRGARYALKRLVVNDEADLKLCKQEIAVMVSIRHHRVLLVTPLFRLLNKC